MNRLGLPVVQDRRFRVVAPLVSRVLDTRRNVDQGNYMDVEMLMAALVVLGTTWLVCWHPICSSHQQLRRKACKDRMVRLVRGGIWSHDARVNQRWDHFWPVIRLRSGRIRSVDSGLVSFVSIPAWCKVVVSSGGGTCE